MTGREPAPVMRITLVYCALCRMQNRRTLVAEEPYDGQTQRFDGFCPRHMTGRRDDTAGRWQGDGRAAQAQPAEVVDAARLTFDAWDEHEKRATG